MNQLGRMVESIELPNSKAGGHCPNINVWGHYSYDTDNDDDGDDDDGGDYDDDDDVNNDDDGDTSWLKGTEQWIRVQQLPHGRRTPTHCWKYKFTQIW